jgi:hypothetical protein
MKAGLLSLAFAAVLPHFTFAAPPNSVGSLGDSPVVSVAQRLNAFAWIDKPAPKAISFYVPAGPKVARHGRGILIKNDSNTGRKGSTWEFEFTRKPLETGVMMIHPLGNGQIVVHLRAEGPFLLAPGDLSKNTWESGDAQPFQRTGAAFPLQSKTYKVTSQLNAGGKYTLSIDGKVAATASLQPGPQLALSREFHGEHLAPREEFPLKWRTGYAALIAGGADKGGSLGCSNLTFQASAP